MAYNNANMLKIAQVGAITRPQFREMPTLDFAGAIDRYYNAKDAAAQRAQAEEQAQKLGAYSEALKSGNQDAINQAWAEYDPQGYSNYVNQQQQREQDRQWQLEDMARKERAAYGLAAYKNNLANIAANAERERENAQLDNALASGLITEAEYNQRKRMQILGDIAKGGDGDVSINGIKLTGNKKHDDVIMKDAAEREIKYRNAAEELNTFKDTANTIRNLLPQANLDTLIERKTPTFWLDKNQQIARQYIQNIMGNLRLDEMQYMKGAISDKEQAFLSDVVSGDISKYTPSQIEGTLRSIERKMSKEVNRYAPPIQTVKGNITYSGKKINGGNSGLQVGQKIGNYTVVGVD